MPPNQEEDQIRVPQSLGLKDLITIISVCVALAMAWGVFGTRITILERDMITVKEAISSQSSSLSELNRMVERVRSQQTQHDVFIDQIYDMMKKPPPRRFDSSSSGMGMSGMQR